MTKWELYNGLDDETFNGFGGMGEAVQEAVGRLAECGGTEADKAALQALADALEKVADLWDAAYE